MRLSKFKTKLVVSSPVVLVLAILLMLSCHGNESSSLSDTTVKQAADTTINSSQSQTTVPTSSYGSSSYSDDETGDDEEENDEKTIADGTYLATVDYNNPETGYSATYTLNVEVQDGQVVQIDFPNGGYLDDDHITPADIDEDGNATVEGEDGKTYEVHIDK